MILIARYDVLKENVHVYMKTDMGYMKGNMEAE